MPIQRCQFKGRKGWKWGRSGKCYASKSRAQRQKRAIFASGYKGKK